MATQYQPERPETGAPSYRNEDGRRSYSNTRPARPQASRFGEAQRSVPDQLHSRNFYACNPAFDKCCGQ